MEFKCWNVTITLKDGKVIVNNLSFLLNKGDKLAIIGEEGNGKSTIIKYFVNPQLIDDYCYCQGSIQKQDNKIGYLKQSLEADYATTCLAFIASDNDHDGNDFERYDELYIIKQQLNEFNLDSSILYRTIATLSGGEKIKLQLVKIAYQKATLLILDEPTNDLDLTTLLYLEDYIKKTDLPVIYVSHDSEFLANTANMILHLEQIKRKTEVKHTLYKGGYQNYLESRQILMDKQDARAYQEEKSRDQKRKILRKFKSKLEHQMILAVRQPTWGRLLAKKMKVVKAQEKRLDKEEENKTEYVRLESAINISFEDDLVSLPPGKVILHLEDYKLVIHEHKYIYPINLYVKGQEHICIVGANGVGKTTLLRAILKKLEATKNIRVGYLPQDYQEKLDYEQNVVDFLCKDREGDNQLRAKIMTYLSAANFLEYELHAKIKDLSGGQKTKVLLIKLIIDHNNVLVLDEPTRNMSSFSAPVMSQILSEFSGTIIAISHDRSFIKNVCDKVYLLDEKGLTMLNSNQEY